MLAHAKALPGDVAPGAGALLASLLAASLIFCSPVRAPVTCCASLSGGSRRSGGMGSPSSLSSPSSSRDATPVSRAHDLGTAGSAAAASSPSRFTLLLPVVGGDPWAEPSGEGLPRPSRGRFLPPSGASSFSPPTPFAPLFPLESSLAPFSLDAPPAWQKVLLRALRLADGRLASSDSGGAELSPAVWAPPDSSLKSSLAAILGFSVDFSWPSARRGSGIAEVVGLSRSWGPSPRPPFIGGAAAPSPILGLDEGHCKRLRAGMERIAHSHSGDPTNGFVVVVAAPTE